MGGQFLAAFRAPHDEFTDRDENLLGGFDRWHVGGQARGTDQKQGGCQCGFQGLSSKGWGSTAMVR